MGSGGSAPSRHGFLGCLQEKYFSVVFLSKSGLNQWWAFRNLKRKALVAQLPHVRKLQSALTNYFWPLRKLRCASRKINPSSALLRCELKKYIIVCALLRCELKRIWLLALCCVAHCRKLKYCVALCRII